jgi:hypothetical protein
MQDYQPLRDILNGPHPRLPRHAQEKSVSCGAKNADRAIDHPPRQCKPQPFNEWFVAFFGL